MARSGNILKVRVMALLSAIALILSLYLTVHALFDTSVGCMAGSSCDEVLSSRWSLILGFLPVASLAVCLYSLALTCCILMLVRGFEDYHELLWRILTLLSGAVAGSALWFFWLQAFKIGAFCPFCMATHITGLVFAVVTLLGLSKPRCLWLAAGLALSGVMALVQSLTSAGPKPVDGYTPEPLPEVSVDDAPLIGRKDAPEVLELLFDYQCAHCRRVHGLLEDYVRKHTDVAFALCPSPLEASCNPYVPRDVRNFRGSCELARLSLAVWRSDPSRFKEFDAWIWKSQPDAEGARAEAERLLGREKLESALEDPWIGEYIATCAEIFGRTVTSEKAGIPRLVSGGSWIIPQVETLEELEMAVSELK